MAEAWSLLKRLLESRKCGQTFVGWKGTLRYYQYNEKESARSYAKRRKSRLTDG